MNVSNSTTPIGERLTDTRRQIQWKDINWKTVNESVNRLQVRITKAVNKEKWQLVKRLQYTCLSAVLVTRRRNPPKKHFS